MVRGTVVTMEQESGETDAIVREYLAGVEHEIRGTGTAEGRRIIRRVKAWAEQTESALLRGETDRLRP